MTEYDAIIKLQGLIKEINAVKKEYDEKYMFNSLSFFRQYMSQHMYPLVEQVSPLFSYISEEKLENL